MDQLEKWIGQKMDQGKNGLAGKNGFGKVTIRPIVCQPDFVDWSDSDFQERIEFQTHKTFSPAKNKLERFAVKSDVSG